MNRQLLECGAQLRLGIENDIANNVETVSAFTTLSCDHIDKFRRTDVAGL